jgi:hypothetical protein
MSLARKNWKGGTVETGPESKLGREYDEKKGWFPGTSQGVQVFRSVLTSITTPRFGTC